MLADNHRPKKHKNIVGLIPAAGIASRLGALPCSKEIFPVRFNPAAEKDSSSPKVVSQYLLEKMRMAGVDKVYIILRAGKWDIPAYFGDGKILDLHIAYLMLGLPFGVPYTLDQAYPFITDSTVVFGFPDILFQPQDAYIKLLTKQADTVADIVLGLFPADQPHKMDMVELNADGRIHSIQIKPSQTQLRYTWIIAVWTSTFTHFMHQYVLTRYKTDLQGKPGRMADEQQEVYMGDVIQAGLENNIRVESIILSDGRYTDIGTPEDLMNAIRSEAKG
jgi:glucose-1-phosphate thymidylyltransferase